MTAAPPQPVVIRPNSAPQIAFLSTPADIAIYGGSAGGGKTWALLIEPLRHVSNGEFGAMVFRRTFRQVMQKGGMWEESKKIYPSLGAKPSYMRWTFPGGATVSFSYLMSEQDKYQYDGAQIPLICFDQLEHFTEDQFFYMMGRNRSMCGVIPYMRATCNPDADSWLADFLSWWIDQNTGYAIPERSGVIRWFVRDAEDRIIWADTKEELEEQYAGSMPRSVTFIRASVYDNVDLMRVNPQYLGSLMSLSKVDRERLLMGNWKIRPGAGKIFSRDWFEVVPAAPGGGSVVRFFDFAATERKMDAARGNNARRKASNDPDYTADVAMRFVDGSYYVEDCHAKQMGPTDAENHFFAVVSQDYARYQRAGVKYKVRWEVEPGAAARRDAVRLVKELTKRFPKIDAMGVPPDGDKVQRAKAMSAQAEARNIKLVSADWNEGWLNHMHHQPDWDHDDIMDASTGAFNQHESGGWARGASG